MTTYGDLLTITQINERSYNEKPFQEDIYETMFFKHPYLKNKQNVKPYILFKTLYDIIHYGSTPHFGIIYPDEIEIVSTPYDNEHTQTIYDVIINDIPYEFYVSTEEDIKKDAIEYVNDNICNFTTDILYENILHIQQVKEVIFNKSEEREEPETLYENENCPVCFCEYITSDEEDLTNDKENEYFGKCGHKLCEPCYNLIIDSNNSRCPICREVWDDATNSDYTEVYWKRDDIIELKENDDEETLKRIIDVKGVCDVILQYDGYTHILGYDYIYENMGGIDTPLQYRELVDGGYEFIVMFKEI